MKDHINMIFSEDTFYRGELVFKKGVVYEVETALGWADRWLKRGGKEVAAEVVEEVVVEESVVNEALAEVPAEVVEEVVVEESVVNEAPKKENKKGKKPSQGK